ncbi:MAG TPA: GspH/FimT family pseudopilin [Gammaproteobacteria bacterium]|nr:GspH/FimT family pseudopilin [Gammaproteobacteria bacterium]
MPYPALARRSGGITLLELIITLAITGVLLAVAVPLARRAMRNARMTATSNRFLHALHLARSEALRRGVRVTLCKSGDGARCADRGGWDQGWLVFRDANADASPDSSNAILLVSPSLPRAVMTGNRPVRSYVSYAPDGATRRLSGAFQAGTLTLCDRRALARNRRIVISRTGRPRVAVSSGAPGSCT